jgi:hypothetical protein
VSVRFLERDRRIRTSVTLQKIIAQGTDRRFLNELKKELKA